MVTHGLGVPVSCGGFLDPVIISMATIWAMATEVLEPSIARSLCQTSLMQTGTEKWDRLCCMVRRQYFFAMAFGISLCCPFSRYV
jgi:hypothetical protein